VVPDCARPSSRPALPVKARPEVASAISTRPSAYSTLPTTSTRKAPKRSASMPAKRPGQAPGQVLHGQREGEGLARPAAVHRDRLQPQAEAVADAHRQRDDGGAAQQHLRHRQRGSGGLGSGHAGDCIENG
jgi:hypothetical protein